LRSVLQNCRGVPFKGPRSLGGSRLKGPSKDRGVQGGRGEGGKVNLPPYRCSIHADGSANFIHPNGPCGTLFWLKIQFHPPKRPLRDAFPAHNAILSTQKAPAGRPSVIPKAKYVTLGPKFFCCSRMTVTRRRKHLFQ